MTTMQSIADGACEYIRVKKLGYNIVDDELDICINTLIDMMTAWDAQGRALGFAKPTSGTSDIRTPDWASNAIKTNLALELAPKFGKQIHVALPKLAKRSLQWLDSYLIQFTDVFLPETLPKGAGNHTLYYNRDQFFRDPTRNDLEAAGGGPLITEEGFSLDTDIETEEQA